MGWFLFLLYPASIVAGWNRFFWWLAFPPAVVAFIAFVGQARAAGVLAKVGARTAEFHLNQTPRVILVIVWNGILYGVAFAIGFGISHLVSS